jgi:hypothetical protein
MSQVGFETTIPVFERAKTIRALDREATEYKMAPHKNILVINHCLVSSSYKLFVSPLHFILRLVRVIREFTKEYLCKILFKGNCGCH